jgi:hypothetical protein
MADLTPGQIPLVANVPNGGVALIVGSSNTVTMGSNTNGATIYTAGTKGGRVYSLSAVTDDAAVAPLVHLYILRGATVIPLGTVTVPISSGNTLAARANVNFLDGANILGLPRDNANNVYIPLMPNDVLRCGVLINLTALKTCWVQGQGSDYQT